MPILNGLETLILIRKRRQQIKVLILTAYSTERLLIQMIHAGAQGYLEKDCAPKELEAAIRALYENEVYSSDRQNSSLNKAIKDNRTALTDLTEQEILLLRFCCSDLSYKEIAVKMGTTFRSVDWFRNSLFKKLGVKSRSDLVMHAFHLNIVTPESDRNIE